MDRLYLAPFIGTGTQADPFRPVGTGLVAPWSIVDLRPDGSLAAGSCLLATSQVLPDLSLTFLGADRSDTLNAASALAFSFPGIVAGMTIEAMLQALLFGADGAWKSCRPSHLTGFKEVVFNGVVWASQFVPGSISAENTMAEDDFVRANEDPMAGNWSTSSSFNGLRIVTNAMQGAAAGNGISFWNANTFSDDQFSQARVLVLGTNSDFGPVARSNGIGDAYLAWGNSAGEELGKFIGAVYTTIASTATANLAVGSIWRLEVEGSTLRNNKNGVQVGSTTDTALTTGSPGFYTFPTNSRMKDWRGGDMTSLRRLNAGLFQG